MPAGCLVGIDPSKHKHQAKKAEQKAVTTFKDVATKVVADAKKKKLAEVTVSKKEWLFREFIYPEIGRRPISELLRVLKKIEGRGHLETAKRNRQLMGLVSGPTISKAERERARILQVGD